MKVIYFILAIFIEPYNNYYQSDEIINQYYDILEKPDLSKDTKKKTKIKASKTANSKVNKDDPSYNNLPEKINGNKLLSINKLNISSKLNLAKAEKGITILNENNPRKNENDNNQNKENIQNNIAFDKNVILINYKIYQSNNNVNEENKSKDSLFKKILKHLCLFCFNSNPQYKFAKHKLNSKLDITTFLKEISEISHIKSLALNPYYQESFNHLVKPSIMKDFVEETTKERTKHDREVNLILYYLNKIKIDKLAHEDKYIISNMKETMKTFILNNSNLK